MSWGGEGRRRQLGGGITLSRGAGKELGRTTPLPSHLLTPGLASSLGEKLTSPSCECPQLHVGLNPGQWVQMLSTWVKGQILQRQQMQALILPPNQLDRWPPPCIPYFSSLALSHLDIHFTDYVGWGGERMAGHKGIGSVHEKAWRLKRMDI